MSDPTDTAICDCHIHVFSHEGSVSSGAYEPPRKDLTDFIAASAAAGVRRAVLIQASIDRTDNSRIVAVLRAGASISLRGIATVDPATADLDDLHAAGIRGLRVQNRARVGRADFDQLSEMSRCAATHGWHIELNTEPDRLVDLMRFVGDMPDGQHLVLDHFGHIEADNPDQLEQLCRLLDTGRVYTKLSPTRVSLQPDYADLSPLVRRLVGDYPERCLWGSDWPHVMTPEPIPTHGPMIDAMRGWTGTEAFRQVMWSNAERLYGFDQA